MFLSFRRLVAFYFETGREFYLRGGDGDLEFRLVVIRLMGFSWGWFVSGWVFKFRGL